MKKGHSFEGENKRVYERFGWRKELMGDDKIILESQIKKKLVDYIRIVTHLFSKICKISSSATIFLLH